MNFQSLLLSLSRSSFFISYTFPLNRASFFSRFPSSWMGIFIFSTNASCFSLLVSISLFLFFTRRLAAATGRNGRLANEFVLLYNQQGDLSLQDQLTAALGHADSRWGCMIQILHWTWIRWTRVDSINENNNNSSWPIERLFTINTYLQRIACELIERIKFH